MTRLKLSTPHPIPFTAVSVTNVQTRLDASALAGITVRVLKSDGSSVVGGASGGIGGKGITQPDVTNAQGCCFYTPVAGDINVLGETIIRIAATGMEPREIPVDVVAYDPYDGIRAGLLALRPDALLVGAVITGSNTPTSFATNLTVPNSQLQNEAHLRFTGNVTASLAGQVQKITGFNTGITSFGTGFSVTPAIGDTFVVVNG